MNPTNNNSNSTPPEFSNSNNQQPKMDDGKTVSIIGLILAFTGLHLIGLILSVIGFKKAKKANSSTGLPMAGIIINAVFWLISTILFIVFIPKFNSFWKDVNNTSNLETSSVEESKIDEPKKEIDSIIVDDVYNYDKVCQNSYKVSNATPYQTGSTNKVVVFYNASQNDENYSKLYVDKDSWSVHPMLRKKRSLLFVWILLLLSQLEKSVNMKVMALKKRYLFIMRFMMLKFMRLQHTIN